MPDIDLSPLYAKGELHCKHRDNYPFGKKYKRLFSKRLAKKKILRQVNLPQNDTSLSF